MLIFVSALLINQNDNVLLVLQLKLHKNTVNYNLTTRVQANITTNVTRFKYRLNLKTKRSTEFITRRPWAVAPERSEGTTKGLRVINYVDHVGFDLDPFELFCTFAAACNN